MVSLGGKEITLYRYRYHIHVAAGKYNKAYTDAYYIYLYRSYGSGTQPMKGLNIQHLSHARPHKGTSAGRVSPRSSPYALLSRVIVAMCVHLKTISSQHISWEFNTTSSRAA